MSKQKGKGRKYFRKGNEYYEGEFTEGVIEGKGTMNFSNYDRYEGDWVNDVTMGKCKYTFSNGDYYEGIFRNLKIEIALVIALKKKN